MKPFCVGCRDTVSTVLQPSWMSIWFLRKRRCQCRGTRHSVSPMVWVCEWLNIFAQWKQQRADVRVCIYLRVCVCKALWMQTYKGQQLCRPWFTCVWPKLESGVKCDLSVPCSGDKDIYWAAHNTALFTDHQLNPLLCGCVINVAYDIFSVITLVSYPSSSASCSFNKIHLSLLQCVPGYIQSSPLHPSD